MGFFGAIGAVAGIIRIFSFLKDQGGSKDGEIQFKFAAALDGPNLREAGGNLPDIRVFNERGDKIGETINDKKVCQSGHTNCISTVKKIYQQPTYTLFSGNNNAMCMAWVTVTFPEQTQYAWIGNWAKECGGDWYYSDIYVQTENGSEKVQCAWLDRNGDRKQTGIQVHWPSYSKGFAANGNSIDYYCKNKPVLNFYTEFDPTNIQLWSRKRDMFDGNPSVTTSPAFEVYTDGEETRKRPSLKARMAKSTNVIKSNDATHLASTLCESEQAVGPSFVSMVERKMCHMADKSLHSFCEDVEHGECWDNTNNMIVQKDGSGLTRRSERPSVEFDKITLWGQD